MPNMLQAERGRISLQGITKTYRSVDGAPIQALAEISLDIAQGEFVTLAKPLR